MPTPTEHAHPDVQLIARALDEITDEYKENNKIIFQNESERARVHFAGVNRRLKDWSKSRQCMIPGCGQHSIKRSHAIPKSMSLRVINESGHVLAPSFDQTRGVLGIQKVGVADATTFPGFCSTHELLFAKFETKGSIDQEPEVYLQVYRAACRELFRARFVVEQHDWMMGEYCKGRDEGLVRLIRERALTLGLENEAKVASFKFEGDPLVDGANERIAPVRNLLRHLEQLVLPALERAVFNGDESGMAIVAASIDVEIPVALAGSGSFSIEENETEKRITLLINVVPQSASTLIVMATLAEEERYLKVYEARWMTHALRILSMIESWMVNGTDQWCLRPSTWAKIPALRATALLTEVAGFRRNVGDECDGSIFDDLRFEFIRGSEDANAGNTSPEYIEFIASERRKLGANGTEVVNPNNGGAP